MKTIQALLAGAFLLAACSEPPHKFDHERRSTNIEDMRTKPKTAYLFNGLGVYGKPGMMGAIQLELEKRGWKVTVLPHTAAKRITSAPRVMIGHSLGANAALKAAQKFTRNHPDLIVSIDAGRAPLWHQAPKTGARVIDIHCPTHPIGGQYVLNSARHHLVCGTAHIAMPHDKRVLKIILEEIDKL